MQLNKGKSPSFLRKRIERRAKKRQEARNSSQLSFVKKKEKRERANEEVYNIFVKVAVIQSDIIYMFKWIKARGILEHDNSEPNWGMHILLGRQVHIQGGIETL